MSEATGCSRAVVVDTGASRLARLRPVPLSDVFVDDRFWAPRRRLNREVSLPLQHRHMEETGRLANFRRAAGKVPGDFQGFYFNDSDVYKWVEAAAWTVAGAPDQRIEALAAQVVEDIVAAQQPDGYLNTYFMFDRASERWANLTRRHELYCAGHLLQAAVARRRSTGDGRLLDAGRRLADLVCATFGSASEGKKEETDGHPEIEMALVELYRETGEARYLDQARFFLDVRRGLGLINHAEQEILPFREYRRMQGHAVCNVYLNAGATDILMETGDGSLRPALDEMWRNMTTAQMYVTGGVGSRHEGEAFGRDHELPNERGYAETCAAIGTVLWSWRMLSATGDARYADLMELVLHNAFLAGLSLDGRAYFYENPLADSGRHRRQEWFDCACCPPNVARLLASLPGYLASTSNEGLWLHLFAAGSVRAMLPDGREVQIAVRTDYPWEGDVELEVRSAGEFGLLLRVPSWCEQQAAITINGQPADVEPAPGSYARLYRGWAQGDVVRLRLPMPARLIEAHPYVTEDRDAVCLMRGPLVYAVEQADNPGVDPRDLVVPAGADLEVEPRPELLGGVRTIAFQAAVRQPDPSWAGGLYRTASRAASTAEERHERVVAIPYHAWANRDAGRMQVWLRGGR